MRAPQFFAEQFAEQSKEKAADTVCLLEVLKIDSSLSKGIFDKLRRRTLCVRRLRL